jgi:acylphosphatase
VAAARSALLQYNRGRFDWEGTVLVARRFLLSGRVQGVGFRYFAQDVAQREGIHGYARNLQNGDVEVLAEGDAEAVARFEHALRRGPRGAIVERVTADDHVPSGRPTGFVIRG